MQTNMMQFFNDELYSVREAYIAYEEYWEANRERFPRALLRINGGMLSDHFFDSPESAIHLHDARIKEASVALPEVFLHLNCCGHPNPSIQRVSLQYGGVIACSEIPNVLLENKSHSDLMCHETTVLEDGTFNHKALFASSDIFEITFARLNIVLSDYPQC